MTVGARADTTFLSWPFLWMDFAPGGAQRGFYDKYGVAPHYSPLPPGAPGPRQNMYGPSSSHPGSVTCLFVDGSVQSISTKIDPAEWFILITKANADPIYPD